MKKITHERSVNFMFEWKCLYHLYFKLPPMYSDFYLLSYLQNDNISGFILHPFSYTFLATPYSVYSFHNPQKGEYLGLPWWSMVDSPPTSAGDMGSNPGLRRVHILGKGATKPLGPQLLSLHSRALNCNSWSPCCAKKKKPPQWEACAPLNRRIASTNRN